MFQINRIDPSRRETVSDLRAASLKQVQHRNPVFDQPQNRKKKTHHSYFEWVQLIATICIPLIIAIYTVIEDNNNAANAEKTRQRDLEIANMSQTVEVQIAEANRLNELLIAEEARKKDRELAVDLQNQNILVEYQKFIANLVLEYGTNLSGKPDGKSVAQFMTATVLSQLDVKRRGIAVRSLYFANLVTFQKHPEFGMIHSIIIISQMDLNNVNFGLLSYKDEKLERVRTISWDGLFLQFGYLVNASFRHTSLSCATFTGAIMDSADFSFVLCDQPRCFPVNGGFQTSFGNALMANVSFFQSHLRFTTFFNAKMMFANLQELTCWDCSFHSANLYKANLNSSRILYVGAGEWKRIDSSFVSLRDAVAHQALFSFIHFNESDWTNVQAKQITLSNCTFTNAKMENSSFERSLIIVSEFINANLLNININGSILQNVSFVYSRMENANLNNVQCNFCDFTNAILDGADFTNASLYNCTFFRAQVNVKALFRARDLSGSILPNGTLI